MAWYIIIVLLGYLAIVFLFNLKLLFYYEHPDDSKYNQGLTAKVTALCALELGWLLLSVLPVDAYNAFHQGGLDMEMFWYLVSMASVLFLMLPVPFATAYYEADTDPRLTKTPAWIRALKLAAIVFVCSGAAIGLLYLVLRNLSKQECGKSICFNSYDKTPFYFFPIVLCTFIGWLLVLVYLGVGLTALPLGLIVGFMDRPKPISQQDYSSAKAKLGDQVIALKAIGEDLRVREAQLKTLPKGLAKWNAERVFRNDLNKFRQSVHLLDNEYEALNVSLKLRGENPLLSYAKLFVGILSACLSALWVVHIVMTVLLTQLLSGRLIFGFLDDLMQLVVRADVFFVDLILYTVLVGYLVACVMIGCFRFNMRVFCCCSIHPMKSGNTHLNSILFNAGLVIITCPAVLHLAYISFKGYCHGTVAQLIFDGMLSRTPVFERFISNNVFVWILMLWAFINFIFLIAKPKDSKALSLKTLLHWRKRQKGETDSKSKKANADEEGGITETVEGFEKGIEKTAERLQNSVNVIGKLAPF